MDKVIRALVCDEEISLTLVESTNLCDYAAHIHLLNKTTSETLGRFLTVMVYLSSCLKENTGEVSVSVKGNGAGGNISVSGNYDLYIRGTIDEPNASLPLQDGKADIAGCVGSSGTLTVIRNDGYSSPFVGTSELKNGTVADDFMYYFAQSEQLPTFIRLGMVTDGIGDVQYAGGIFLQPMPFAKEQSVTRALEVLAKTDIEQILRESTLEDYLQSNFGEVPLTVRYPEYRCTCSREYISSVLMALGKTELEKILKEQGKISVHCHYCNSDYVFDESDVAQLFADHT